MTAEAWDVVKIALGGVVGWFLNELNNRCVIRLGLSREEKKPNGFFFAIVGDGHSSGQLGVGLSPEEIWGEGPFGLTREEREARGIAHVRARHVCLVQTRRGWLGEENEVEQQRVECGCRSRLKLR